jgi:drug/metabolite transporter superfamily protein YnfA
MATATPNPTHKARHNKWRTAKIALIAVLVLILLLLMFNFATLKGYARLGTGYAAHVTCSCRYIEGRDMESCANDAEAGMEIVSVSDDPEHKRVTATVPFLANAAAELRGEYGCQQLNKAELEALE